MSFSSINTQRAIICGSTALLGLHFSVNNPETRTAKVIKSAIVALTVFVSDWAAKQFVKMDMSRFNREPQAALYAYVFIIFALFPIGILGMVHSQANAKAAEAQPKAARTQAKSFKYMQKLQRAGYESAWEARQPGVFYCSKKDLEEVAVNISGENVTGFKGSFRRNYLTIDPIIWRGLKKLSQMNLKYLATPDSNFLRVDGSFDPIDYLDLNLAWLDGGPLNSEAESTFNLNFNLMLLQFYEQYGSYLDSESLSEFKKLVLSAKLNSFSKVKLSSFLVTTLPYQGIGISVRSFPTALSGENSILIAEPGKYLDKDDVILIKES